MAKQFMILAVMVSFALSMGQLGHAAEAKEGSCAKLTCANIKTCKEAMALAAKCPGKTAHLDKNGDGMPCDSVCGKKKPEKKK